MTSGGLAAVSSSFFAALYSAFGRYDVVHIHAEGPAFFCWIPKLFGKRVVSTIHGLDWNREKWHGSVASKFIRGGEKNAVKYADEIIVLSKGVQKYFMEGAEWFSITDRMARYVVSNKKEVETNFYNCYCSDEVFIQTLWLNAPFYTEEGRYHSNISNDPNIDEIYHDVMRAADWNRGTPYVFDERDYKMLVESGCLFARKMSENKSMKLIGLLEEHISKFDT